MQGAECHRLEKRDASFIYLPHVRISLSATVQLCLHAAVLKEVQCCKSQDPTLINPSELQLHVFTMHACSKKLHTGGVTCWLVVVQGHAIECRINAEDPFKNFRPGPGRVVGYLAPGGPYVRMDSHLYPDYLVSPH